MNLENLLKKTPRYKNGWWVWDCAYIDAKETPSMLYWQIFKKLGNYWLFEFKNKQVDITLQKGYITKRGAKKELKRAIKRYIKRVKVY